MSVQQDLLSTTAKIAVFELKEGFYAVAHIPEMDHNGVKQTLERRFLKVWNYIAGQNVMFSTPYNMKGLI